MKPGIKKIEGKTVHFVDGSSEEIDSIIAATGYETDLAFLPAGTSPLSGTRLDLYNRIVHPALPNVFFIGFFDVTGGSNIRMMDDQAEYLAAVASGAVTLPDRTNMAQAIAEDHAFQAAQFPESPRYGLELDPVRYRKRLKQDYARSGFMRKFTRPVTVRTPASDGWEESSVADQRLGSG